MNRKTHLILGLLALLLAGGAGYGVYVYFERLTTTATVPVPRVPIPAGALIAPELLTERDVPRTLLNEPIYTSRVALAGRVAQIPLQPGLVVYQLHAVAPRDYRLVDDPALVVVSLPSDPTRAVGGQVQPGHRIDVWALPRVRGADAGLTRTLTATLVVQDAPVVDVRSSQGQAVARQAQAVPGQYVAGDEQQTAQRVPLQILTVALPLTQTETLLHWLTAEENGQVILWTALAPLVRPARAASAPTPRIPEEAERLPPPAVTPSLTVTTVPPPPPLPPTPTPSPPPLPATWVITGTAGLALRVRAAPGGAVLGSLDYGTLVTTTDTVWIFEDTPWYYVTPLTGDLRGWVSGAYLEAHPAP